ncbi:MAG TPA: hypothetical protein DEB17_08775 [Chlorobaculum sp.]|uniref:Uncharacterized protein n=1 Tax=Chlorobaculum tepidum (strain ATCC 49652 / DSM 12025 / NBRC 103806 / TLS) TaxID=194439 RepID=Q8KEV2_CHLTE|nr:hypothetical protein CT0580 [Chlorobaculum tepidum TLS]HBU24060.1 hypothetical protein [Chlorobaculum sp.]
MCRISIRRKNIVSMYQKIFKVFLTAIGLVKMRLGVLFSIFLQYSQN